MGYSYYEDEVDYEFDSEAEHWEECACEKCVPPDEEPVGPCDSFTANPATERTFGDNTFCYACAHRRIDHHLGPFVVTALF